MTQFFNIKNFGTDTVHCQWASQDTYWDQFDQIVAKLNLNEEKMEVVKNVAGLGSVMLNKASMKELKRLANKNPDMFLDPNLLSAVILMLTFFKFRTPMRRQIHTLFDKLLSNNSIYILDKLEVPII
jgi:hypothetical protein